MHAPLSLERWMQMQCWWREPVTQQQRTLRLGQGQAHTAASPLKPLHALQQPSASGCWRCTRCKSAQGQGAVGAADTRRNEHSLDRRALRVFTPNACITDEAHMRSRRLSFTSAFGVRYWHILLNVLSKLLLLNFFSASLPKCSDSQSAE